MADEQQPAAAQSNNNAAPEAKESTTQGTQAQGAAAPKSGESQPQAAAGEKPAAAAPGSEAKKEGTPASAVTLELPEGSKLTAEDVDKIASFAKEHGLSQDAASALLKRESDLVAQREELAMSELQQQSAAWKQEIVNDKEFGGEKANETAQMAHEFAKRFGDEHFVNELERTGLGNHPGLVKLFARAGKAMAPDVMRPGGQPAGARKATPESKFYSETTPV